MIKPVRRTTSFVHRLLYRCVKVNIGHRGWCVLGFTLISFTIILTLIGARMRNLYIPRINTVLFQINIYKM